MQTVDKEQGVPNWDALHAKTNLPKLFGGSNRLFTEVLQKFGKFQSGLASARTGSFIAFGQLKLSIGLECGDLFVNFGY